MRLAVLDASAVGGGPISRALECAAAEVERHGAETAHVRLYGLFASCCASCAAYGACAANRRCSARHAALDEAAHIMLDADLLLVGVISGASQRDSRAEALLRRLVGCFGRVYDPRHGELPAAEAGCAKSAGLVSSAPPLLAAATALGAVPYGLGGVSRVLHRAGVDIVGAASVARRWSGPASWDVTRQRAVRLGRALAWSPQHRPVIVPAAPVPAPVSAHPLMRTRVA
jgi:hypothetical protein